MLSLAPDIYRDLIEFAPDALIAIDAHGTIIYANSHAHTLFEYGPGALRGVSMEQLIPYEARAAHIGHCGAYGRETRLRDMGNRGMPLFGVRKSGARFRADIHLSPISTPDGLLSAATIRDATETERIMHELAAARSSADEANDANDAKSRLLAAASHDLRQPMQSLRLLNGALKRLVGDPNVVEVLDQEEHAINTMSELLHALLNISKLDSGTLCPTLSAVSVRTILEDLRQQFSALMKLKHIELLIISPDVRIYTDPVLLRELLQNLLANAVRYTDKGSVTLKCTDQAEQVILEVEDTGIGIPTSMQEKIFDDFFQAIPRGNAHRGGAGLGLGIVRRLSKILSIPVQIHSTVGIGTRFTLAVPVAGQATPQACDRRTSVETVHSKGRRIILVEDDRGMRNALSTYLRLDSHEVNTAGSLLELDELLASLDVAPAIVISDFHLGPRDRGSDAIEKIRRHFDCKLPAILLTGDTSAVPRRSIDGTGIRILNKPVDAQRLGAIVDELVHPTAPTAEDPESAH